MRYPVMHKKKPAGFAVVLRASARSIHKKIPQVVDLYKVLQLPHFEALRAKPAGARLGHGSAVDINKVIHTMPEHPAKSMQIKHLAAAAGILPVNFPLLTRAP